MQKILEKIKPLLKDKHVRLEILFCGCSEDNADLILSFLPGQTAIFTQVALGDLEKLITETILFLEGEPNAKDSGTNRIH